MRCNRWFVIPLIVIIISASLQVTYRPVSAMISGNVVSDSELLTAEDNFYGAELQQTLVRANSPLVNYYEHVSGQVFMAGDLIWLSSQRRDFGVNPKVLLATLDIFQGLQIVPAGEFSPMMNEMAENLWIYTREYNSGVRSFQLPNRQIITFDQGINAATFALAKYISKKCDSEQAVVVYLTQWREGYKRLFQVDPLKESIGKGIVVTAPFMSLPFSQPANGFIKVNSFFDHHSPRTMDDYLMRFDGKGFPSSSSKTCTPKVSCYGGHNAIDYGLAAGNSVYAAAAGTVVYRYFNKDSSQGVVDSGLIIDHANGYRTLYWHQDVIYVKQGDIVTKGQLLGLSGNVGKSSAPHLHFGLRLTNGSKDIDPYGWWSTITDPWDGSVWAWEGDLVSEVGESQAQLFYNDFWTREPKGYNGDSWWTRGMTSPTKTSNWGIWGAYITTPGQYNVYAYWPNDSTATTGTIYRIFHSGGISPVSVNQSINGDKFNLLGTYYFNQGSAAVMMDDLTTDLNKRQYYDAIKWEPVTLSPSSPNPIASETIDDNDSRVSYSGSWAYESYGGSDKYGLYNGTAHVSTAVGSVSTFSFHGNSVAFLFYTHPTCGQIGIEIDGILKPALSQYTGSLQVPQRWESGLLSNGDHTIKLTHLNGQNVTIDGFLVSREVIPSAVEPGTYDNSDVHIVYTGNWLAGASSNSYNGSYQYSNSIGSSASLTFTGSRVSLIFSGNPNYGGVMTDIDYVYVANPTMKTPSAVFQQRWDSPILPPGTHTITITHSSGAMVEIDALIVTGP